MECWLTTGGTTTAPLGSGAGAGAGAGAVVEQGRREKTFVMTCSGGGEPGGRPLRPPRSPGGT
jgi:hypothetical protein